MELTKIRSLGDAELAHQEKTASEQLFRLRFQVSMGQNDGVKKLRQLRKEIAQIKTVARERELGVRGTAKDGAVETAKPEVTAKPKTAAMAKAAAKPKTAGRAKAAAKPKKGAAQ
ncbi:MAG TPA: 50S ribosomal protein L29 [Terracidiphilus sp.]|nr:50S ribosomal protein L29 [Terracidiphilus sp.]